MHIKCCFLQTSERELCRMQHLLCNPTSSEAQACATCSRAHLFLSMDVQQHSPRFPCTLACLLACCGTATAAAPVCPARNHSWACPYTPSRGVVMQQPMRTMSRCDPPASQEQQAGTAGVAAAAMVPGRVLHHAGWQTIPLICASRHWPRVAANQQGGAAVALQDSRIWAPNHTQHPLAHPPLKNPSRQRRTGSLGATRGT